ncbi:MAG: glucose-1-phosphate adenylyltransferase [Verrucomicrobiae bacterium]|nr:glucose-1-phosphate adenylyltransferase [Verrucomicrobiae bacterium]
MSSSARPQPSVDNVIAVIMGGGQGTRLAPLTRLRAKPAVPLGAKFRLVDIPISNCINSDIRRIYLLTQFNSASLHRHILQAYRFDRFSRGFIEICAAQQTLDNLGWYQGTADAVRRNLRYIADMRPEYVVILSGDQLYRMDYRLLLQQHVETEAEITVAAIPVPTDAAGGLGILQTDDHGRIIRFVEKPKDAATRESLRMPSALRRRLRPEKRTGDCLASMGIYVFNADVLTETLANDRVDFGKDILPSSIASRRVFAYLFQGYWEDIGTIRAFFEANLLITKPNPPFNFFDLQSPIYTRARHLPASLVSGGSFKETVIAEGCLIGAGVRIERTLVGIRSLIGEACDLKECVLMGNDHFEDAPASHEGNSNETPPLGIGARCVIRRTIVDKNVHIGADCAISPEGKPDRVDEELYCIRDGIVVIPKGTIIPAGTKI